MSDCIAAQDRIFFSQNRLVHGRYYSSATTIRFRSLCICINTPSPFIPRPRLRTTAQNPPKCSSKPSRLKNPFLLPFQVLLSSLIFFAALLFLRRLPRDLPLRWRHLLTFSEEAEAAGARLPSHVWQVVIACEDRRFFSHCGIDIVGILRAILLYPDGGGGSTITQQLVKNVFLKHERKFSRKAVEIVLAIILERKMSKWRILCSYLSKIYWGHGLYGLEAASAFYFGKHPSFLSLGESAMLAGIIPSPDRRSPVTEPSRGMISQARALRRMVEAGFLDVGTALLVVNQPLHLHVDQSSYANGLAHGARSSCEERGKSKEIIGKTYDKKEIWNWERASAAWKVREDMEEWAMKSRKRSAR